MVATTATSTTPATNTATAGHDYTLFDRKISIACEGLRSHYYDLFDKIPLKENALLHYIYEVRNQTTTPKPSVVENIPQLKRKEISIYKPSDVWTNEDDAIFLRYCPSKRIKCYHAVSGDTSCRPHEILKLRVKDIVFKTIASNRYQYAEVLVNGKTGPRHLPLINSIPYVKDWLDHEHPQPSTAAHIRSCR
jgi:integrase